MNVSLWLHVNYTQKKNNKEYKIVIDTADKCSYMRIDFKG